MNDRRLKLSAFIVVCAILCSCNQAINNSGQPAESDVQSQFSYDNSTGFLDGFRLKIARSRAAEWNGQLIDDQTLQSYLREVASKSAGAGSVFVEFEPNVPQRRRNAVQKMIVDSGLCKQNRCAEVGWAVPRPVVN